jgi:hypothetical protein
LPNTPPQNPAATTQEMNDLETALIATMEAIVRLHSVDHEYLSGCDCSDAQAFQQGKLVLASHGIDFDTETTQ